MSGEVLGGRQRADGGGWMADDKGQWWTADREKFLLCFSTAVKRQEFVELNYFVTTVLFPEPHFQFYFIKQFYLFQFVLKLRNKNIVIVCFI